MTETLFFGTSDTAMVKSILSVYERATNDDIMRGLTWYGDAHMIARESGNVVKGAGIIAALSPRMPWHRNIELSRVAFNAMLFRGALKRSIDSTNAIINGTHPLDVLGGLKTRAFFDNIVYPLTSIEVTVDTHAIKIAGIDKDSVSKGMYNDIANAYRVAAQRAGMNALDMQAITWTTYRRENVWTHRKDS